MKIPGLTVAAILACLVVSGCSAGAVLPPAPPRASAEPTRTPELVRVPRLEDAIRAADTTATYEGNPRALADQLRTGVERYYAARGLKAEVEYQSIVLPDSEEPTAGAMVPRGTVVNILIGFGD